MKLYGIEKVKIKKSKKKIAFIAILAVAMIAIASFSGMKLASYVAQKKQVAQENQKNTPTNENKISQEIEEGTVAQEVSLTKEQMKAIDNIYNQEEKTAFLTFDDGPSSKVTAQILDILKQEKIKATFFVLGTMVKSNPELIKRENEEGHYIANHGYSHIYKKIYANENKPLEEYHKTNQLIQQALGDSNYQSKVFRFPGGSTGGYYDEMKTKAKKVFNQKGIAYLDWNALTNDSDGANTKQEIIKNLKTTCKGKNSVVILMHDAPNKEITAKTLPEVIAYLREEGYCFKNLYDIF